MSFRYRRRVGWAEVDPSSNYQFTSVLRYVEEAEVAWMRELHVLDQLYPNVPRTFVRADFRAPAHFDDEVTIMLDVDRIGRSSVEIGFRVTLGETLCASGTLGVAYIGQDGSSAQLPEAARAALESTLHTAQVAGR